MRRTVVLVAGLIAATALVPASASAQQVAAGAPSTQGLSTPAGDIALPTVPRPPEDPGSGTTITRRSFTSTTGNVACRRVHQGATWLECLLVRSGEILRVSTDADRAVAVPCTAKDADVTCRLSYPVVTFHAASRLERRRFADARRVRYERPVQLGPLTAPYPTCLVDPNLGTSCHTGYDDRVGEQVFIGVADSVWICPGYEHVQDGDPVPVGADTCLVVRP
ncbi:MAG: hypothetical protein GC156_14165 [Actinomycetales bacterium]|nr:hypothetical protein [Actinomycetales bacterium]